jgi:hypothetical protein
LDEYDLVARGKMSQNRGMHPVQIARMDNNGEILFACMFLHYEIRYAFLNYLLEKKMIEAPADFKSKNNNSPTIVRNLVFWIKTEKSN